MILSSPAPVSGVSFGSVTVGSASVGLAYLLSTVKMTGRVKRIADVTYETGFTSVLKAVVTVEMLPKAYLTPMTPPAGCGWVVP